MLKKISFKGVIVGGLVDVIGSVIWGIAVGIYLAFKYNVFLLPQVQQMTHIQKMLSTDTFITTLNMVIGGGFVILGGYIAARIARRNELLNGTFASFLCVIFVLLSIGKAPVVDILLGVVANPILGLAGGYFALKQSGNSKYKNRAKSKPSKK